MLKIGLSTCGKNPDAAFFDSCAENGIACVEISPDNDKFDAVDLEGIRRYADASGVELWSFHLPFCPFETNDISSRDEDLRKRSVQYLSGFIRKASEIGIRRFIVHPSAEPIDFEDRIFRIDRSRVSLSELMDVCEENGAVLCAENLPRTCLGNSSYEMRELTRFDKRLRICLDTNHLLAEYIPDFIRSCGSKIESLHVSDCDLWNERHWLPGEGKLDWNAVYSALISAKYSGPWLYEVNYRAPASLSRKRDLTPADFTNNAREIFDGKPLTVLGTPAARPGFWGPEK